MHMHLLSSVTIQPNLELKTRPKQLLGSLPLVIALPVQGYKIIIKNTKNENLKEINFFRQLFLSSLT